MLPATEVARGGGFHLPAEEHRDRAEPRVCRAHAQRWPQRGVPRSARRVQLRRAGCSGARGVTGAPGPRLGVGAHSSLALSSSAVVSR